MVKVRIFFFYLWGSFKCMIVILPTFWRSARALKFSWQLARYVSLATMLIHSYQRSLDEDGRSLWVGTSRSLFTAILRAVWLFFFFTRRPRQQFPLPANLHRHSRHTHFQQDETSSLLDRRRHESHQTYRSYQLVLHLGTSTTLFPAIWTKTARSIEELFSQWTRPKRASSDRRTDEEDTSETCNNNNVGGRTMTNAKKRNWGRTYIYVLGHRDGRFCDVYTSRGSERVNKKVKFNGARCPFSTFLCLQGDHYCACTQKWCHFSFFSKSFQTKKKLRLYDQRWLK